MNSDAQKQHLKILKRAFFDAYKSTYDLKQDDIHQLEWWYNVFGELIVIMPLKLAKCLNENQIDQPRRDLVISFSPYMEKNYLKDSGITLSSLEKFLKEQYNEYNRNKVL